MGYSASVGGSGAIRIRGIGGQPNTDVLMLIDGLSMPGSTVMGGISLRFRYCYLHSSRGE